jgi:hypothetical protein
MPATGRRELDERYKPLAFEELAAVFRVAKAMEEYVVCSKNPMVEDKNGMLVDLDTVHKALTRIKFITPEEQS